MGIAQRDQGIVEQRADKLAVMEEDRAGDEDRVEAGKKDEDAALGPPIGPVPPAILRPEG
ncbi:MAG: hypothetical protein ACT4O6_18350 [Reyranella sp.]